MVQKTQYRGEALLLKSQSIKCREGSPGTLETVKEKLRPQLSVCLDFLNDSILISICFLK